MSQNDTVLLDFQRALQNYKEILDTDIAGYCEKVLVETKQEYGEYPAEAVAAFCTLLERGGKRIRGSLVMVAYEMFGGTNYDVALQAARAIEMLHAYILMVDDIQDRSETRRGGPTAHILLKQYHESKKFKDDPQHFGQSITMNGFLFGAHSAINILANLEVPAETRLEIIKNVNNRFIATAHGQTMDIFNEVVDGVDEESIDKVLLWKTAYYTFMNPLQLGAILAGATDSDLEILKQYSLGAGRAFQITDDILGIFGDEEESGKSSLDDIREGKRTLLTVKALELAAQPESDFLHKMLGNKKITQEEFLRCREIIKSSGALQYAENQAKYSVEKAVQALNKNTSLWNKKQVSFLTNLVQFLVNRTN